MNTTDRVAQLLDLAVTEQQAAHRIRPGEDASELRAAIRRLARLRGVRIRTALIDDVVAVVRTDAAIWNESTETMRRKLTPAGEQS